jgi:hypothetical protein
VKKALFIALGIAALGLAMAQALSGEARFECEACMEVGGRSACGRVAAPTRDEAHARAVSHACGIVVNGVTATLACERETPRSVSCRER